MARHFQVALDTVQPTQLYISRAKLEALGGAAAFDRVPVPVKQLDGRLVFTDGHTRALSAWLSGARTIAAVWEHDELDWAAYRICVDWCLEEGIRSVADLAGRVVEEADYERLWLARCRAMHRRLGGEGVKG